MYLGITYIGKNKTKEKILETYESIVAWHYQSYRPPIHKKLIEESLPAMYFKKGLDVGCGTGYATLALVPYCDQIWGFDSSQAMLQHAKPHPKITYVSKLQRQDNFDLLCFFGSLNYVNTKQRTALLNRLSYNATILCCDFTLDLTPLAPVLGVRLPDIVYDPSTNLSHCNEAVLDEEGHKQEYFSICCSPMETAHLFLSDSNYLKTFQKHYMNPNPMTSLTEALGDIEKKEKGIALMGATYWTRYVFKGFV